MQWRMTVFGVCLLLYFSTLYNIGSPLNILLDGVDGNDSQPCLSGHGHKRCKTMEYVANNTPLHTRNLAITIISTKLELKDSVNFSYVNGIAIAGNTRNTTIQCISNEEYNGKLGKAIIISHSYNIVLQNITIKNCGRVHINEMVSTRIVLAFGINSSQNILLNHVRFIDNAGYGLVLVNTSGHVHIKNSLFERNGPQKFKDGRYNNCNTSAGGLLISSHSSDTVYNVTNTIFNTNANDVFPKCKSIMRQHYWNAKRGGGVRIELQNGSKSNSIKFMWCHFRGNVAANGGGAYVRISNASITNNILFQNCSFHNNTAGDGGGGIDLGVVYSTNMYKHTVPCNNSIRFLYCNFTYNHAKYGGAVALFSSASFVYNKNNLNDVTISESIFHRNQGKGGAAVNLNRDKLFPSGSTFITAYKFNNCCFTQNGAIHNATGHGHQSKVTQSGVFFTREIGASFTGITQFENNSNTAIYCASAIIEFQTESMTKFFNNKGERGGAILLVGNAQLQFQNSIHITFENNAAAFGGAICAIPLQTHFLYFTDACFIKRPDNYKFNQDNSSSTKILKFNANQAKTKVAKDIFVSTLLPCKESFCETSSCNYSTVFSHMANFGIKIHMLDNSSQVATATNVLNTPISLTLFPGIPHQIEVHQEDQLNHTIAPLYPLSARLLYSQHGSITLITGNSATLINNTINVTGDINDTGIIILATTTLSSTQATINISLVDCPAGYYYNNSACHCSPESSGGYYGISYCMLNQSAIIFIGLWAGYVNNIFYTGVCPTELCSFQESASYHGQYALPVVNVNNIKLLEEHVCASNRRGILCGECTEGHSTFYHSPSYRCGKCNGTTTLIHGVLYYIVSELLPVTVIFLVILLFDIRLTSGAFYTFLFYAQFLNALYINAHSTIRASKHSAVTVYSSIYGIFNFKMFNAEKLSFCLWPNATVLHLFVIQYITALYALLLIVVTVFTMKINSLYTCIKLCHRFGRRDIRGSIINALSAFLVLCYSECVRITFSILTRVRLLSHGNSHPIHVPLFNGQLLYMKHDHLYFAIPAIVCLIIIILPPPLILLTEPLLIKLSSKFPRRIAYCLIQVRMKLKPFLDSFQGCFKDNCRIFAGLFFFYRIIINLPTLYSGRIEVEYVTAEGILFVLLLCHCLIQPFQNKWYNRLDIFLLFDLLAVNTLTIIEYYSIRWPSSQLNFYYFLIQLFLITFPLIYICGYACHYTFCLIKVKMQHIRVVPATSQFAARFSIQKHSSMEDDHDESLPARLLNENMISWSYNSLDD